MRIKKLFSGIKYKHQIICNDDLCIGLIKQSIGLYVSMVIFRNLNNQNRNRKMSHQTQSQISVKKLMKIIYQKERQVEKYRMRLKEKEQTNQIVSQQHFSVQEKRNISQQLYETQQFISHANTCIKEMQATINELQNQLQEQQHKNVQMEQQIKQLKAQNQQNHNLIESLNIEKESLIEVKEKNSQKIIQQYQIIDGLQQENTKLNKIKNLIEIQRNNLNERISNFDTQLTKGISQISKCIRKSMTKIKGSINSEVSLKLKSEAVIQESRNESKIHSKKFLPDLRKVDTETKVEKMVEYFQVWQENLEKKQAQFREKYEKELGEHSILGISKLIDESVIYEKKQSERFTPSPSFLQQQEDLLKKLEEDCAKSDYNDKSKLIQLSQVKQSLKMTKQVNIQLFEELGKKQSELKQLKDTLKSLQIGKKQNIKPYR